MNGLGGITDATVTAGIVSTTPPGTRRVRMERLPMFKTREILRLRWAMGRSARGLKRVGEKYPAARVEAACESALRFGARSYRAVERMLQLGREASGQRGSRVPIEHDNVRGPEAFDLN